ncbi:hypothetical protein P6F33_gp53 [Pseudomonas phage Quinobequin-P09]|uniref:Uncharacterized protein n=1 Tax=Pseudomonas phage Quinobequin-P09 TaxID=2660687 RepID=A0A5P8PQU9_9CAUD|nr:hypothetical protein P6F33_gp53 [Pseudomonas phage Quinobequin-P09]QFR59654.1 hypothetical protein QuinobequinP09_15 [Pseudomonas phage Quinobequin-P09]
MTTRAQAWARLPAELKYLRQWCVAGANKAPLSVGALTENYSTPL